jgi:DNA-binding GntR family transcriptional regulator
MKSDIIFKRTLNGVLDYLSDRQTTSDLEAEARLAKRFAVSRTTMRKALNELERKRIVARAGATRTIVRKPSRLDYFPRGDTIGTSDRIEKKFMEWMLRGDLKPGDYINGLGLARQFDVSTNAIREYLNRFGRFGLVEKRENSGWIFRGFTTEFALELFEVRELFELRSARAFAQQPPDSPAWRHLKTIEVEHRELLKAIKTRYHDFSDLDERFHRLINGASKNRFMEDFYGVITLIFHYHYQWRKADEKERNAVALREHLRYIGALFTRNPEQIEAACRAHLKSARNTLLASID